VFSGAEVSFRKADFSGGKIFFRGAEFSSGRVTFDDAVFSGSAVTFLRDASDADHIGERDAAFTGGIVSLEGATALSAEMRPLLPSSLPKGLTAPEDWLRQQPEATPGT
jgi:hypothetical protein